MSRRLSHSGRGLLLFQTAACALVFLLSAATSAQEPDTLSINVHFLYGSKPKSAFRDVQPEWFGGKLGGHVGIEVDPERIIDFVPAGDFHVFSKKDDRHSRYAVHSEEAFYRMFGGDPDSMKKTVVVVPISPAQKRELDSLSQAYLEHTPYDYAFFGMRCAAATYEVLGQLEVMKAYSRSGTVRRIFYPRKLRKRLLKKAAAEHWTVLRTEGCTTRRWDRDPK